MMNKVEINYSPETNDNPWVEAMSDMEMSGAHYKADETQPSSQRVATGLGGLPPSPPPDDPNNSFYRREFDDDKNYQTGKTGLESLSPDQNTIKPDLPDSQN